MPFNGVFIAAVQAMLYSIHLLEFPAYGQYWTKSLEPPMLRAHKSVSQHTFQVPAPANTRSYCPQDQEKV